MIIASMLYNYAQCPHRMMLELFGDSAERDPPNPLNDICYVHGFLERPRGDISRIPPRGAYAQGRARPLRTGCVLPSKCGHTARFITTRLTSPSSGEN